MKGEIVFAQSCLGHLTREQHRGNKGKQRRDHDATLYEILEMVIYLLQYRKRFTVVFYIPQSNSREGDPSCEGLRRVVFACFEIAPPKHTLWHSDAHIQDPKRALFPSWHLAKIIRTKPSSGPLMPPAPHIMPKANKVDSLVGRGQCSVTPESTNLDTWVSPLW